MFSRASATQSQLFLAFSKRRLYKSLDSCVRSPSTQLSSSSSSHNHQFRIQQQHHHCCYRQFSSFSKNPSDQNNNNEKKDSTTRDGEKMDDSNQVITESNVEQMKNQLQQQDIFHQERGAVTMDSIKRLSQISRPEWPLIGLSAATLAATSSTTLLFPYASGQVIDLTIAHGGDGGSSPMVMAIGLFGLVCLAGGGIYLRSLWLAKAGNRIVARIRQQTFARLLIQENQYLEHISKGDVLSRLSSDSQLVQAAVTTHAVAALRNVVVASGSAAMLIYMSPALATISLCTLPPIFIMSRSVGRTLRDKQQLVQEYLGDSTSLAEQALSGMDTVKQYGGEGMEAHRYAVQIAKAHSMAIETADQKARLEGLTHVAANGAVLAVLGYGGSLVLQGQLTPGDLTGFVLYSFLMAGNLSNLSGIYAEMARAAAASERIVDILDRSPKIPPPFQQSSNKENDPLSPKPDAWWSDSTSVSLQQQRPATSIKFQGLDFAYPSRPDAPVLSDLHLEIEPGEIVALVGGSGSGKSTVARLLTRLYEVPQRNTILIDNQCIHDIPVHELRSKMISVVSQDPVLFQGTIADNIRYGSWHATDDQVLQAAKLAHVLDFTNELPGGLETVLKSSTSLSGGQRQRVAIARAILKDSPLVILDEATASLDARSEYLVQKAMGKIFMQHDKQKTVLSIAHRLSTIRHADKIAVLQNGRIVQQGIFDDLSKDQDGAFWKLMRTQL